MKIVPTTQAPEVSTESSSMGSQASGVCIVLRYGSIARPAFRTRCCTSSVAFTEESQTSEADGNNRIALLTYVATRLE